MAVVSIEDLCFGYTDIDLLKNASLKINEGEHVGLVGLNGCGKTTLMNLLALKISPDRGSIVWDKNKTFSYLDQMLVVNSDVSINEYLYSVYNDLFIKEDEMNKLYESLGDADASSYDKILAKAERISEYLEKNNFYRIKSDIGNIINCLGIDIGDSINDARLLKDLSGGQRARVFLGKMLLEKKDVLLLDEPTNFLDVSHIEWLGKFLSNYKKEFVVISHDPVFLNNVCNYIVDLDGKMLTKYKGNYDAFIMQKETNREAYIKQYNKQQEKIKKLETYIAKNLVRASTTKQAQSRRKELEKMDKLEKLSSDYKMAIHFPFTHSFNMLALEVKNLSIGYDKVILKDINVRMEFGRRYIITGANGVGKTTFIKTIMGIIRPKGGKIKLTPFNDITYFSQDENVLDITPIDYIRLEYPRMDNTKVRTLLGNFGVKGELALSSMKELSGGENCKVRLARISLKPSNMLILDEPTNHLDRVAKDALVDALNKYDGTIILVSHDKDFYKRLSRENQKNDKIIEINFKTNV